MKSKKVFKESCDWGKHSVADTSRISKFSYSHAYKVAGDLLVDKVLETGDRRDILFLPICFCYRHFIELSLKEMIEELMRLINGGWYEIPDELECNFAEFKKQLEGKNGHNLEWLWGELQKRMEIVLDDEIDKTWDKEIEGYVLEFHQIDVNSQAFRYPLDKKGGAHFKKGEHYDIDAIKQAAGKIERYYWGIDGYVDSLIST